MDLYMIIWLVTGGVILFSSIVFILIVAGKDILFALHRFLNPRGAYVFIVNSSRFADIYYLTPKENSFRINGSLYATNPKKCINIKERYLYMTPEEQSKIEKATKERQTRLEKRIEQLENRKENAITKFKNNSENPTDEQINKFEKAITPLNTEIKHLQNKLVSIEKTENYFFKSRPAFFFIENDPIPKDFYELYSEFDSKILDNLAARAATSAAKLTGDKSMEIIKWLSIAAAVAAAIAAIVALRNQSMLNTIATNMGTSLTL